MFSAIRDQSFESILSFDDFLNIPLVVGEVLNGLAVQIQMEEGVFFSVLLLIRHIGPPINVYNIRIKVFCIQIGIFDSSKAIFIYSYAIPLGLFTNLDQKIYEKILEMASLPPTIRRWKLEERKNTFYLPLANPI